MANAIVFGVRHQINAVCGDVLSAKTIQSGALLVRTASQQENETLLNLTHFLMRRCSVVVVDGPNTVEGLIHCPEIAGITEEAILHELAPQDVVEVLRLRSKNEGRPNPLISFQAAFPRPGAAHPHLLRTSGRPSTPVRLGPRQCRNCWHFGQDARFCRSSHTTMLMLY